MTRLLEIPLLFLVILADALWRGLLLFLCFALFAAVIVAGLAGMFCHWMK